MGQKGTLSPNPHGGEHRPWRSELTYNPGANNGNISGQTISGTHGLNAFAYSQTYTYDNLNRLETVLDSGVGVAVDGRSQIFVYDRYGNRALKQNSFKQNGAVEVPTPTAAAVEAVFPGNRLNNCCNAAGDATALNGKTIAYDGEHRVTSVAYTDVSSVNILLEYFYDADGRRIRATKKSNGTLTSSTVFVYDSAGQLMAEYTTPSPASEGRQYLTQDHLGSTRLVTKATGTDLVFSRHDFMPFGEELARGANGYGPSALAMKFTGKERDAETGLDYFGARYMSSAQGRFTSPDAPFADQYEQDPQSWNMYSYVRNNPLSFVDPTGRCSQAAGGYTDEGSGLFPGPCSGGTIGNSDNNTNSVTVTGKKGNAVGAFLLNAVFALDSTANNYFAWMFKERPRLLENTPTSREFVGQAAAATVFVGTAFIGPGSKAPVLGRKLDYLLGLATGSAHNIARSGSMASALNRIGIHDSAAMRQYLAEHLTQVLNDSSNIISRGAGTEVRESLLMGPGGAVKLETVWQGDKLITAVVKEGAR